MQTNTNVVTTNNVFLTKYDSFMTKKYVSVLVWFDETGKKFPREIYFDDQKYEITKVLDVANAASLKVGGIGQRYKVKINGQETYLFFESETGQWFVEAK